MFGYSKKKAKKKDKSMFRLAKNGFKEYYKDNKSNDPKMVRKEIGYVLRQELSPKDFLELFHKDKKAIKVSKIIPPELRKHFGKIEVEYSTNYGSMLEYLYNTRKSKKKSRLPLPKTRTIDNIL